MLQKFETINFKSFKEHLVFDLTAANYSFNKEIILHGIISKAMIYGENASGKSNIGHAIFDIINSITDKQTNKNYYNNYACLYNTFDDVYFKYTFKFNEDILTYEYIKSEPQTLLYEKLSINDSVVLKIYRKESYNRQWETSAHNPIKNIGQDQRYSNADILETTLQGTESLNTNVQNPNLSIISYIKNNANLDYQNINNSILKHFFDFVDHMLWFRNVESNSYQGLVNGRESLDERFAIGGSHKLLQKFLNECGIQCKLGVRENRIVQIFEKNKIANFFDIASSGTKSLALFFYWSLNIEEHQGKLLFIDEFDSTYHTYLAQKIITKLKNSPIQVIVTSHNTNLIDNSILRPDAYFILRNNTIHSMNKLTDKELREIHNLEKLYLANTFSDSHE